MLGSSPNVDSDGQPSQQINFGSVSMPFLDMNSFQPARPKGQTGFESMESMDSALNSTKTTPLNYMRSSVSNRNKQTSDLIHPSSKGDQFEDSNLNALLQTSSSAHSESNADLLNTETFGESADLEPWSETPRTALHQTQRSSDPDLKSFSLDSLNLNASNYQEGFDPYYGHNSSADGVAHQQQPQVPSRVQQQLQNLQHHQQQQYRQQGNFYGAPGQGNQLAASAAPYVPTHHQMSAGLSGIATAPRHAHHSPSNLYHSQQQHQQQQQQQQMYGAPYQQQQNQHQQQHQQHQTKPHQYNHGSYASAPHTPLSVYRPALQASQQLPAGEEADPLGAGFMPGAPVTAGQPRPLYPGSSQQAGSNAMAGPSVNQARSPRMGYAQYQQPPLPQQMSAPQGPYAAPGGSMGPPSGMMSMPQELVYQVQFKLNCRAFTLRSRAGFTVNERDFVVVEADRGEDIGIVVEIMTMHAFLERRMNAIRPSSQQGGGVEQEDQNVGCILRLATLHERQQLPDKFHAEKEIVQSCGDLAQHGFGLPITVFEAEFQFDRRKLTIFYDCTVRIDFRDFVRQLYSTYKARIWMKKMSPSVVPDIQPFAAMALATGVQFSSNAL